jgi:DNA repair protein RecO (recombination protein O)
VYPKRYTSEGIVLARRNFSEADRILVVYTKHFGKLSLLAKGVRKPKSRKRGHIEIFSRIKFSSSRGKSLDLVTEVEVIDSYNDIRKELRRIALAYYFMEVIGKISQEYEQNEGVYQLILQYFNRLKSERNLKKLRLEFISELLIIVGFWPSDRILVNHDKVLEKILERQITSVRVGRKMLS